MNNFLYKWEKNTRNFFSMKWLKNIRIEKCVPQKNVKDGLKLARTLIQFVVCAKKFIVQNAFFLTMKEIVTTNNCNFFKELYIIVNVTSAKMWYKNLQVVFTWRADVDINFAIYAEENGIIHIFVITQINRDFIIKKTIVVAKWTCVTLTATIVVMIVRKDFAR